MSTLSDGLTKLVESELITKEWAEACPEAFQYFYDKIGPFLKGKDYYPESGKIFRAFNECSPEKLKVVILGQDPYFDGSATGLAFDNSRDQKRVSPSLRKILKEMDDDMGTIEDWTPEELPMSPSHLGYLPQQGVLLVNTALTVEPNYAGSHIELWRPFTWEIIKYLSTKDNIVWILWGNYAKAFIPDITNTTHHIIEGTHPAARPNVRVPFEGGKYFSQCNAFLEKTKQQTISW